MRSRASTRMVWRAGFGYGITCPRGGALLALEGDKPLQEVAWPRWPRYKYVATQLLGLGVHIHRGRG
jgi:hypothetical protein